MEQENNNFSESDFSSLPEIVPDEPESGLVHSKVPFSPWLSETCFFYRRYFKQFVLLGLITAFLSYGSTYYIVKVAKMNRENEAASDAADLKKFDLFTSLRVSAWKSEEKLLHKNVEDQDSESGTAAASDSDKEPVSDESVKEPESFFADESEESESAEPSESSTEFDIGRGSFRSNQTSTAGSFFALLSKIFSVMIFCWAIKTLKTDNGSFRNLLFPSNWTLLKLAGSGILVSCIIVCVGFAVFVLALIPSSLVRNIAGGGGDFLTVGGCCVAFLITVYFAVRYLLTMPLIIDQNVSVFRSLKMSKQFMKKNISTLLRGALVYILVVFLLSLVIYLPLMFYFGEETFTSVNGYNIHSLIVEGDTSKLRCLMSIAYVVLATFTNSLTPAAGAVFYTMATGQYRPGAWERDNQSSDPADENKDA